MGVPNTHPGESDDCPDSLRQQGGEYSRDVVRKVGVQCPPSRRLLSPSHSRSFLRSSAVTDHPQLSENYDHSYLSANSISIYLQLLRNKVAETTFQSHQNTLQKLSSWHCEQRNYGSAPKLVGKFTEYLHLEADLAPSSVTGHIYTTLNYISYQINECPDTLRMSIIPILENISCSEATRRTLIDEFSENPSRAIGRSVRNLVLYLREREYGTRTHVYVALILASAGRPEQVRRLDTSDITQSGVAHINISDTYIVARTGLQQTHATQLPPYVVEVLETYLQHERKDPRTNDCQPLLTTSHGRASASTLRRSVKQANRAAHDYAAVRHDSKREELNSQEPTTVVPSDIWRVALSEVVDSE